MNTKTPLKLLLLLITLAAGCQASFAQKNIVRVSTPRTPITSNKQLDALRPNKDSVESTYQYYDGLGRLIQTVQYQASPLGFDMVMPQAYDQYGREVTKYLPYTPQTGTAGSYRPNAVTSDQNAFYSSPPSGSNVTAIANPYAQTNFDNSPLDRPTEQGAPGAAWQLGNSGVSGSGHTMKMLYTVNTTTTFATDSINGNAVRIFLAGINAGMGRSLSSNGSYAAGTLSITTSKDENWAGGRAGTMEEYKDIDGHVVCKRTYNYINNAVQQLSTYYVYDDLGYLAFVIPPGANPENMVMTQATLDNLCYQYRYDERGRMAQKKLPGKGWEFMVYNTMDQVVMTQDANQRNLTPQQWTFTKYDALARVVLTGIYAYPNTGADNNVSAPNDSCRLSLQNKYNTTTNPRWEARTNSNSSGYDGLSDPQGTGYTYYKENFYDDYSYAGLPSNFTVPAGASLQTRGLPTASFTGVLGAGNTMLADVSYYDDLSRPLTVYSQHYLGGTQSNNNYDVTATTYNFTNAPTTVTRQHYTTAGTGTPLLTVYNKYIYDQVGRKVKTWEQLTNGGSRPTPMTLVSNTRYNEIGQVYTRQLHSTDSVNYLQSIAYGYNERGWLLTSSAPLFAMKLYYNVGNKKQYNGNIVYQYWGVPGNLSGSWYYTYDRLNRLTSGVTGDASYREQSIVYNPSGDIASFTRYLGGSPVDYLTFNYSSGGSATYRLQGAADGNSSNSGMVSGTTAYTYDVNGNQLSNTNTANTGQNKSTAYNVLNLPGVVSFPSGNTTAYTYDAGGRKLRKVNTVGGTTTTTDYVSGIQYSNGSISLVQTEEGQAVPNGTGFDYQYFLGDNLGNTRVTFGTKTGSAVQYQKDDYYPFGLEISRTAGNPKNEYLYNKKELQEETGLYDYGARFYDPLVARWTTVDPLAEMSRRWSPYNYVENNPIKMTDPDGMEATWDAQGNSYFTGADAQNFARGLQANEKKNKKANKDHKQHEYVATRDHTANKSTPKDPRTFSTVSYEERKKVELASQIPNKANHSNFIRFDQDAITEIIPATTVVNIALLFGTDGASSEFAELGEAGKIAFYSGIGAKEAAIDAGYTTIGMTSEGAKLEEITKSMLYEPGSEAYNLWKDLSEKWANSVPKGSTVNVFLNNPSAQSIWLNVEKPILESRGVTVIINPIKN